jgi:hypothetical protein
LFVPIKITNDVKSFLTELIKKPVKLDSNYYIPLKFINRIKSIRKNIDINKDEFAYYNFIDRLCRALSFTSLNAENKLFVEARGKQFIFLDNEKCFETLFFGWLYYFPWNYLFPFGILGNFLEKEYDNVIDFLKVLDSDEVIEIESLCDKLSAHLSLDSRTELKSEEGSTNNRSKTELLIKKRINNWGIRHMVFQPLSWFEFLGFHDIDMEISNIRKAKYIVLTPFFKEFLQQRVD